MNNEETNNKVTRDIIVIEYKTDTPLEEQEGHIREGIEKYIENKRQVLKKRAAEKGCPKHMSQQ
jgi:hypothetical protein